jgi:hypothetical protein
MRLQSFTLDELVASGVKLSFARILAAPQSYHADLKIIVGRTDWDYFVPNEVTDIVPLWDSNANSFVRWKRAEATEYVWLLHDDPDWILVARTEQGIMAKLWQEWIEFQDSDDAEARQFAEAIGFRFHRDALRILATDSDEFQKWIVDLPD